MYSFIHIFYHNCTLWTIFIVIVQIYGRTYHNNFFYWRFLSIKLYGRHLSWKYGPTARLWFQLRYFEGAIKKNNDKIYATNIEILHKFFKDPRICICDNSCLSSRRNPIGRFMSRNDNTHLLYDGNKIFASNLKSSIRECLGIRFQPQPYRRSDNWTYNNPYHDGPYDGQGRS